MLTRDGSLALRSSANLVGRLQRKISHLRLRRIAPDFGSVPLFR